MASIGLNVAADGRITPESIKALRCSWVRVVARQEHDLSEYLVALQALSIRVLLVFDRTSVEQFGSPAIAFEFYDHHYGLLVDAMQIGNEPDIDSPSSWTMAPAEFTALGWIARRALPNRLLVAGGMASGQPSYLVGQDVSWCDVVACHPYLKDGPNPNDLEDLPDVDILVADYAMLGKQVWISEWGWWGDDEQRGAEEIDDMVGWAAKTQSVGVFFYFAADDAMVAPFGLYRVNGTAKPAAARFMVQAGRAVPVPLPEPKPVPDPEPEPMPEPVLSAREAAFRDLWTAVVPDLDYNPDAAFARWWKQHPEAGSPVGPERADADGVYQAFAAAGLMQWMGGDEIEKAAVS